MFVPEAHVRHWVLLGRWGTKAYCWGNNLAGRKGLFSFSPASSSPYWPSRKTYFVLYRQHHVAWSKSKWKTGTFLWHCLPWTLCLTAQLSWQIKELMVDHKKRAERRRAYYESRVNSTPWERERYRERQQRVKGKHLIQRTLALTHIRTCCW